MLPYDELMQVRSDPTEVVWTDRETILYALGVGFGRDLNEPREQRYIYEQGLVATPTFATVLAACGIPSMKAIGADNLMMLHGEQRVEFRRPLPPEGRAWVEGRIVEAIDKGQKGAIVISETTLLSERDEVLAVLHATRFCRADGGFGGPTERRERPHETPARAPDTVIALDTRPEQAALYRLSGDRNPVHVDPAVARAAGFPGVILHGLCTFGMACRAILASCCGYAPEQLTSLAMRFSSPVYPGEPLSLRLWREGPVVAFEMAASARDVVVLKNGKAELA
jgi:acyl dehydratase